MYLQAKAKPLKYSSKYLLDSEGRIDDFLQEEFRPRRKGQWNQLLKKYAVSTLFLDKYADTYFGINEYYTILIYQNIPTDCVEIFLKSINAKLWYLVSRNQCVSEEFIKKHQNEINWNALSILSISNLSLDTIRQFADKINWCQVVMGDNLTINFFREFKERISWICVHERYHTLDFIREFQDQVCWSTVSSQVKLPMEFIEEFADKVHWKLISESQQLSEDFIRKHQDRVSWHHIFVRQSLSDAFMEEFSDRVVLHG